MKKTKIRTKENLERFAFVLLLGELILISSSNYENLMKVFQNEREETGHRDGRLLIEDDWVTIASIDVFHMKTSSIL